MMLQTILTQLEDAELVRALNEPELTYIFKHTLTQEIANQLLLHRARREISHKIACVYESVYADQLDEIAPLLARHFAEANQEDKAFEYAARAGDAARRVYAHTEALAHYTQALELAARVNADSERVTHVFLQRGRVHELNGHYERALDDYRGLHSFGHERGDRATELAALMASLPIYATPTSSHDPEMARMLSERGLALARELGDRSAEAKILWTLMLFTRWSGDPVDGVRYGEESLRLAREFDLREQMAFTLNDLGVHGYLDTGQFRRGLDSLLQAQELWRKANNLPMLADSFSGVALLSYALGNYDDTLKASEEARQISESIDNLWGQSYARWIVGNVYADRGEPKRAIEEMEEGIRLGEQAGFTGAQVGVRVQLAMVYAHFGWLERGVTVAERGVELARVGMSAWLSWARRVQARTLVRIGNLEQAAEMARAERSESGTAYLGRMMGYFAFHLELAEAELALARQDLSFDPNQLSPFIAFVTKNENSPLLPDLYLTQARAYLLHKNMDAAILTLGRAREIAERLKHRRTLWRIYAYLGKLAQAREDAAEATSLRHLAREVVDYIAAHADGELQDAFLSMADVRAVLHA